MHDGRDGIKEGEFSFASEFLHGDCQRGRGQRPGGDDDAVPVFGRQPRDLTALDGDQRLSTKTRLDFGRERIPVNCERAACRQLVLVARRHDQRTGAPQLLVQQPNRVGLCVVRAE